MLSNRQSLRKYFIFIFSSRPISGTKKIVVILCTHICFSKPVATKRIFELTSEYFLCEDKSFYLCSGHIKMLETLSQQCQSHENTGTRVWCHNMDGRTLRKFRTKHSFSNTKYLFSTTTIFLCKVYSFLVPLVPDD